MTARSFVLYRHVDPSGISGVGVVAEGAQWSDGTVSLRWLGPSPSFSNWDNLGTLLAVHGHQGATEAVFAGARQTEVGPGAFTDLVEASSLGTPEAQALRASVSDERAQRAIDYANRLRAHRSDHDHCPTCESCSRRTRNLCLVDNQPCTDPWHDQGPVDGYCGGPVSHEPHYDAALNCSGQRPADDREQEDRLEAFHREDR